MSHDATNWAMKLRGLAPTEKIVLYYLADCHNAQTGFCRPTLDVMADLCEMSRSTIVLCLKYLERRGLIKRYRATGNQVSDRYVLEMHKEGVE